MASQSSVEQGAVPNGSPTFLTIGHITTDLHDDGSTSLGGTVTFAAVTASRLGLAAAIATRADKQLIADLPALLPGIKVAAHPSPQTTAFANHYHDGTRTQYMLTRADSLQPEDIPGAWHDAPIVLLGPLTQELSPAFGQLFPRREGALLAATPQGWMRRWDADGRVWPAPWADAEATLPRLDALILSYADLQPFTDDNRAANALLARWSMLIPLLVVTDGLHGATLFQHGQSEHFPAYAAEEVDPTGAGDVFAAAFLCRLHECGDPRAAVNFANCVASFSIEQVGIAGIPSRQIVERRLAGAYFI